MTNRASQLLGYKYPRIPALFLKNHNNIEKKIKSRVRKKQRRREREVQRQLMQIEKKKKKLRKKIKKERIRQLMDDMKETEEN